MIVFGGIIFRLADQWTFVAFAFMLQLVGFKYTVWFFPAPHSIQGDLPTGLIELFTSTPTGRG